MYSGYLRESDGAYHGAGTCTYPGSHVYEGEWKDDKRNGQGSMAYADGRRESGEWRDNKFLG